MEYLLYFLLIGTGWQVLGLLTLSFKVWNKETLESKLPVTVVVCSKGGRDSLTTLLRNLEDQNYYKLVNGNLVKNFSVLLVADRWTKAELALLEKLPTPLFQIQVLFIDEIPEGWDAKKYLIDRAVSFAETEHLLFTDDDCLPKSRFWIQKMAAEWEKGADIVVGFSPYNVMSGLLNYLFRFETYTLGLQFLGSGVLGMPYMALGRNMGYTKTFYFAVKGMQGIGNLKGGDDDLLTNKGAEKAVWGFALDASALVWSEPVNSFKAWKRQKLRHFKAGTRYSHRQFYVGCLAAYEILRLPLIILFLFIMPEYGIGLVAFRILVYNTLQWWVAKKWELGFSWIQIVVADIVYPFLYLYFGVLAFFHKPEEKPW